ncbi:hypothetical protein B0O80DRAFT_267650 [Mortierella sp. GBAus27b]|nr:hypothetical protein B0O80DRAFT_267650 [Mortierella sp. GBAus27b]
MRSACPPHPASASAFLLLPYPTATVDQRSISLAALFYFTLLSLGAIPANYRIVLSCAPYPLTALLLALSLSLSLSLTAACLLACCLPTSWLLLLAGPAMPCHAMHASAAAAASSLLLPKKPHTQTYITHPSISLPSFLLDLVPCERSSCLNRDEQR